MSSLAFQPLAAPAGTPPVRPETPTASAAAAEAAQADKEVFLKLLVAQLQNQNPAEPADPIQFVTQLAQFSGLEQSIAMRQELEAIRGALEHPPDRAAAGAEV